jgi:anti-sigma B factor antagonist
MPEIERLSMSGGEVPVAFVLSHHDETMEVAIRGEIDLSNSSEFRGCMKYCLSTGCTKLTLEVSDLTFLDSSGLSALIEVVNELEGRGGQVVLVNPTNIVRRLMELTGLTQLIEITQGGSGEPQLTSAVEEVPADHPRIETPPSS